MGSKFSVKLSVLFKVIQRVQNWYVIPLVYFGLFRKEHFILHLKTGQQLKLRTHSTDIHAFVNVWIMQEYRKKDFEINEGDVVIDVGAHIGLFTVYASQFCKKGKIFSFEPIKENFDLLLENLSLNDLRNVCAHNLAVSDKQTQLRIYLSDSDQAAHTIHGTGSNFVDVESTTLEHILDSECDKADLVKLDCEGAEYDILESLPADHFRRITKLCMEYHTDGSFERLDQLKKRLEAAGYTTAVVPTSAHYGLLFANRQ